MKLRITILAACAAILATAPALARDGEPIAGVDTKLKGNNRAVEKGGKGKPENTTQRVQQPKLYDSESPRPQSR